MCQGGKRGGGGGGAARTSVFPCLAQRTRREGQRASHRVGGEGSGGTWIREEDMCTCTLSIGWDGPPWGVCVGTGLAVLAAHPRPQEPLGKMAKRPRRGVGFPPRASWPAHITPRSQSEHALRGGRELNCVSPPHRANNSSARKKTWPPSEKSMHRTFLTNNTRFALYFLFLMSSLPSPRAGIL